MGSPGGYAKLSALDEDENMDEAAKARSFANCPSEKVMWPERSSSFVSRWLFIWVTPMLKLGSTQHLEHEDLWSLDPKESTGENYAEFKTLLAAEHERANANADEFALWRPALALVRKQVLQAAVLRVANTACSLLRPLVLQQVLLVVEGSPAWVEPQNAWMLALGMMACSLGEFMGYGHYMHFVNKASWRLREAIIGMLYNHVTDLNLGAKNSYSGGKITNLMSTDADRVRFMTIQLNLLWIVPIQFCVSLYLVMSLLGPAGLVGLVMTLLLTPITRKFIGKLHSLQTDARKQTDERVRYVLECMSGIRILKFMNWEESFVNKINVVREKELGLLRQSTVYRAAFFSVMMSTPLIVTVFTLGIYTMLGNPLTPSVAFPAMALLQLLREPLSRYPYVLTALFVEGRTALERIQSFLKEIPVTPYVDESSLERSSEKISIRLTNATFRWCPPSTNTAWAKGQRGGWENIVGYKTIVKFLFSRVRYCFCGGEKYRLGEAQIAAKKAASAADAVQKHEADVAAEEKRKSEGGHLVEVLQGLDLVIPQGSLCCIVGKVGSGKSSLLHAILGEMDVVNGTTETNGVISYAAQSAFIMNATLRDNILFGSEYDEGKYNNALDICALVPDLDQLAAGDQTQIGERGINLSGGQRQRVALARAVYQDADTYLLDDPLSAVDAHTGKHIFHKCIMALRNAGKTVILPCHALSFLRFADHIVSLKDNRIDEQGSFRSLLSNQGDFADLMESHSSTNADDEDAQGEQDKKDGEKADNDKASPDDDKAPDEKAPATPVGDKNKGKIIKDEERAKGTVDKSVYQFYMRQVGVSSVIYVMFCFVMGQLLQTFSDWWMSRWAIHDLALIPDEGEGWTDRAVIAWFLGIYATSGVAIVIFTICKTMIIQLIGFNAARKIHRKLLWRLMKAPVRYFDVTPVGRIVNRFSSDMSDIDNQISQNFMYVFSSVLSLITGFGLICSILPWFILYLIPVFYLYYRIQDMYRKTAREMKRLNSSARSPIFQHFDETLSGLITIRSNRPRAGATGKERFSLKNEYNIDYHMRAEMALNVTQRWLTIWLSSIGAFTLFVVVAVICWFPNMMDAGLVGMVINYSMMASGTLQGFIDSFSQLELQMNSVERVKEYSTMDVEAAYDQEMEQEEAAESARQEKILTQTRPGWPEEGRIEFKGVTARYRPELDRVLIDLNLDIKPREKVGIVGRTGSGKSTLVQLLFRILELESGTIAIDGIDIFKMGLKQLRTAIAMLPQDPVLFSGTVRTNLDPFDEHSTATIWDALEKAQMKEAIESLPAKLDADVGDGGGSFSVGERQLLCLGRAILRDSKVLVMDECTASVDVRTDEKIQEMIRVVFNHCTVFAIAHRLATIIDYDKVVVLEKGELQQFGAPLELLAEKEGIFARLVEETGPAVSAHLHALARGESRSPSAGGFQEKDIQAK